MNSEHVKQALKELATPERAKAALWYFKTGPGQYGEGDEFIGVTVPNQRKVARQFKDLPLPEIEKLLKSKIHEHRLTALFILVGQFQQGDEADKEKIHRLYLKNTKYINNWDLVDSSAPYIVGIYLVSHPDKKAILKRLASSGDLWERRIAMMGTFAAIRQKQFDDAFAIAEMLLTDKHDLIHKAVGWMLREVGNQDLEAEESFLQKHYKTMPRTMLRYAIEKFTPEKRAYYLNK